MAKISKTNAMRHLDQAKIAYQALTYDEKDGKIDGVSVAHKIGKPLEQVFKTLVCQGADREYYVFVIPVAAELDLKKAAKAAAVKSIEMAPVKDLLKISGYVHGGCSPIGMKKLYRTFVAAEAQDLAQMVFSAGKIGQQIECAPQDLASLVAADFADLCKAGA